MNKNYQKIIKTYRKKLNQYQKMLIKGQTDILNYFVLYLEFLRDLKIISIDSDIIINDTWKKDMSLVSLVWAINEFWLWVECLENFGQLNPNYTDEDYAALDEISKRYLEDQTYHWTCFWQAVEKYLKLWVI